jgi:hypothetical protein
VTAATPRILTAAVAAFLALAVVGCGGGGQSGVSTASGASLVRSDVLAFVAIDSDLGSSQWQQVDELSHKFRGRSQLLNQIKEELAKQSLEYGRDIEPALGPEVDIAVAAGASLQGTSFAVLTKPDDARKYRQLVQKLNARDDSGNPAVYREVDGWYALSDSQAKIDAVLKGQGGDALADDGTFEDALGKLPNDALAKAYLNGPQLARLIGQAAKENRAGIDPSTLGLDKLDFVSASLSAEGDGLRVRGAAKGAGTSAFGKGDYSSKLLAGVPSDALAFLTFRGEGTVERLKENLQSNPSIGPALQQLERELGVSLSQLLDLFRSEVAFYVRPGVGIPEFTLALEANDQSGALATLDKLAARVAALAGGRVSNGEQGGYPVKTVDLGRFGIHYGGLGDKVVITNGVNGVADYAAKGEKLADSADFKEARNAAGMPDSTGAYVYVDLKSAIPLVETLIGLAGETPPASVTDNLRPLRSFLAWTAGSGDSRSFDAFLEIK